MSIPMKRNNFPPETKWSNAGLLFDIGFAEWDEDDGLRGKEIGNHIGKVCDIPVPEIYEQALLRWQVLTSDTHRFSAWCGRLSGRMFIGLGLPHVLETQVTRHHVYGIPMIPGSALKGLARAASKQFPEIDDDVRAILFGSDAMDDEGGDSGHLIFHDAWWLPGNHKSPYVPEIVTVHAGIYYQKKGKEEIHPDFESPNPNHQIGVRGSFYFVVEGAQAWAERGMTLLKHGLKEEGIGGKINSGYGYFEDLKDDDKTMDRCRQAVRKAQKDREEILEARRIALQHARKKAELDLLSEQERNIHELEQLVTACETKAVIGEPEKNTLNTLVNRMLLSDNWSPDDRKMAFPFIQRAYSLSLPKKKRQKKLVRVQEWLEVGTTI